MEHTFNSGLHLLDSMDKSLYCIERPAKSSKDNAFPLFLIHGYGSDENDLFSFANAINLFAIFKAKSYFFRLK